MDDVDDVVRAYFDSARSLCELCGATMVVTAFGVYCPDCRRHEEEPEE